MAVTPVPAVFVDKDGTLVRDVPYNVDPDRIVLLPGVASGMRGLHAAGFRLVVVSNQPGVAMGLFELDDLARVEARLSELLGYAAVPIEGYFWCPHAPHSRTDAARPACECRKPMPGLLLAAAELCNLDLASSWMIGDILDDVEAGHRAGCRAILVDRGGETEWQQGPYRDPDAIVHRFDDAVRVILGRHSRFRLRTRDRPVLLH